MLIFHQFLNEIYPNIAFTLSSSSHSLQFLDLKVCCIDNQLHTELFTKETDQNTLLYYDSWHPRKMIDSLPFSQMLRAKRIVDVDKTLTDTLDDMEAKFKQRGYPDHLIRRHRKKINNMDRQQAQDTPVRYK